MTRTWPYPDPRDGITIGLTTDTHLGRRDWTAGHLARVGKDLDWLAPHVVGMVHCGDGIHWDTATPEDDEFVPWLDSRRASGVPWLPVVGNHDLASFTAPYPNRPAVAWSKGVGLLDQNNTMDLGGLRVIAVGPDSWTFDEGIANWQPMPLSAATLEWLDGELTAAGSTPCWIAAHSPIEEQYSGHIDAAAGAGLDSVIGAHSNVIGWLSGHRHANIDSDPNQVRRVTVAGRSIVAVNGPAAGGLMAGASDDRWGNPARSAFITYDGTSVTVRWREHLQERWATASGALSVTV